MVSFDNTQVAFSGKSDKDLQRSYWLFKMIGSPLFVSIGKSLTTFALKLHLPIKGIIKATIFKQFVGGENISECAKTVEALGKYKVGTILDYSVEGKETEEDFDKGMEEIIATIERAKNDPDIPFCVFKVTGLAPFALLEKSSAELAKVPAEQWNDLVSDVKLKKIEQRVDNICKRAHDCNVPVFIDAEESWIQNEIDHLANTMMARYNKEKAIVYNTFQLYRKDRLAYLKHSLEMAEKGNYFLGAKLVRGAYMEKERKRAAEMNYPSPIQDTKADTDRDYNSALEFCVAHVSRVALCAGTHNENSSALLVKMMEEKQISAGNDHIYFSQLLGMSDHISFNLSHAGYKVAKYVPDR